MTKEQVEQLTELRQQGYGYRLIAQKIGVNRDKVRYFCKSRGLDGKAREIHKDDGVFCPECGSRIEQTKGRGRHRRFCSEVCRRSYWKAHPDEGNRKDTALYHLTCECCKKPFISYGNKGRRFCSRDCYIQHRFWEK